MCWLLCLGWPLHKPRLQHQLQHQLSLPVHPLALCLVSLEDHLLRLVITNPVVPRLAHLLARLRARHRVLSQA